MSEDCIVAAGAQDQKCAALGTGLDQDTMTVSLGTAGAVTKLWREALPERYTSVGWCGYTDPGAWVTEGVINTAGTCLRWVRDTLFPGEGYDTINREAKQAAARGSRMLFYPYLNGPSAPDYYPDAEGCFYGASLSSTRGDFALAVMRGVAFQIRIMLEAMGAYSEVTQLVLFGGGARSPLWCQCISDAAGACACSLLQRGSWPRRCGSCRDSSGSMDKGSVPEGYRRKHISAVGHFAGLLPAVPGN